MAINNIDEAAITAAVQAAELTTKAEIVPVITASSDHYGDIIWGWVAVVMWLKLCFLALLPTAMIEQYLGLIFGWHFAGDLHHWPQIIWLIAGASGLFTYFLLKWRRLHLWLTPNFIKRARVKKQAIMLFGLLVKGQTEDKNGALLLVSLAEHRAELLVDEAILAQVNPEQWGEAMALLLTAVKAGDLTTGMIQAIAKIGAILAEIMPLEANDRDELSNHLIILP